MDLPYTNGSLAYFLASPERTLMPKKIIEILMTCPKCKWFGPVIACDCDDDYPEVEDEGRLRCPKCGSLVSRVGHE